MRYGDLLISMVMAAVDVRVLVLDDNLVVLVLVCADVEENFLEVNFLA